MTKLAPPTKQVCRVCDADEVRKAPCWNWSKGICPKCRGKNTVIIQVKP